MQNEACAKEDIIKSQFMTREGTYKQMTLSEYSRPNRVPFSSQGNPGTAAPVRASFVTVTDDPSGCPDRLCFNVGRELFVYPYRGLRKAADLSKPIDKRIYKGTFPTCHDFCQVNASAESFSLLVGFSAGQIQLIDPARKDLGVSKLFNEDRLIDKTRVTGVKWLPKSGKHFLVAHGSGNLYLYKEELPCCVTAPTYQITKQGDGYTVFACKMKATRNPIQRWSISDKAINEFTFSPDGKFLAVSCQDGYLKLFNYETMDLVGFMSSYFGGILCCAWSPDGKYVVTGGEDDLVNVYSFNERRVVCRGHGHRSWVSQVAFDPYTTSLGEVDLEMIGSEEDLRPSSFTSSGGDQRDSARLRRSFLLGRGQKRYSTSSQSLTAAACYRFGSISHDTQLCLWDLTEDLLKQPPARTRTSSTFSNTPLGGGSMANSNNPSFSNPGYPTSSNPIILSPSGDQKKKLHTNLIGGSPLGGGGDHTHPTSAPLSPQNNFIPNSTTASAPVATTTKHRKTFSLPGKKSNSANSNSSSTTNHGSEKSNSDKTNLLTGNKHSQYPSDERSRHLGTAVCPRLDEVPFIEPLVTKKIAHERLTVLIFREDCFVTACQEGFICTWARPGKSVSSISNLLIGGGGVMGGGLGNPPGVAGLAGSYGLTTGMAPPGGQRSVCGEALSSGQGSAAAAGNFLPSQLYNSSVVSGGGGGVVGVKNVANEGGGYYGPGGHRPATGGSGGNPAAPLDHLDLASGYNRRIMMMEYASTGVGGGLTGAPRTDSLGRSSAIPGPNSMYPKSGGTGTAVDHSFV